MSECLNNSHSPAHHTGKLQIIDLLPLHGVDVAKFYVTFARNVRYMYMYLTERCFVVSRVLAYLPTVSVSREDISLVTTPYDYTPIGRVACSVTTLSLFPSHRPKWAWPGARTYYLGARPSKAIFDLSYYAYASTPNKKSGTSRTFRLRHQRRRRWTHRKSMSFSLYVRPPRESIFTFT